MLDSLKKRRDDIIGKKEGGFTIVEVMIVLAIAGLIILIVFLAVPALQRNSRNTQRSNDAGIVGAAVSECLGNRNGQVTSCDTFTGEIDQYVDVTKLRQFTTITVTNVATAPAPPTGPNFNTISVDYGSKCDSVGAVAQSGPARSMVLLFNTENQQGGPVRRCQDI